MDKKRIMGFIGLCRKAGKLLIGHDTVKESIVKNKAVLVLLSADASDRLKQEAKSLVSDKNIKLIITPFSSDDFYSGIGKKSSIFSVTDKGFANKTELMFGEE